VRLKVDQKAGQLNIRIFSGGFLADKIRPLIRLSRIRTVQLLLKFLQNEVPILWNVL